MFRLFFFMPIFMFSFFMIHGQNKAKVDSLISKLATTKNDSIIIEQYLLLAAEYLYIYPDEAYNYGQKALKISQNIHYKQKEAEVYRLFGVILWIKTDLPAAIDTFLVALRKFEEIDDQQGVGNVLGNIGLIYAEQKDYPEAMQYYEKSLAIQIKLGSKVRMSLNYNNMGDIYFNTKKYEKALEYYQKSLQLSKDINNIPVIVLNKINISEVYLATKNYKKSLNLSLETEKISYEIGDMRLVLRSLGVSSESYLGLNQIDSAELKAIICIPLLEKTKLNRYAKRVYLALSKVYEYKQDYKNAFKYRYSLDSIEDEKLSEEIKGYRNAYENEKMQKEKEAWEKQKTLQRYFIIFLSITGFLILIMWLVTRNHLQKNKQINIELQTKNVEVLQQQKEIQAQAEQLQEINDVKDKLFSIVAHDLKNPINSLKGVFFLVEDGCLTIEEISQLMLQIKKQVISVEDMMTNLLLWARSQLSSIRTEAQKIDILTIIEENYQLVNKNSEAKNIELIHFLSPETVFAFADINQIRVVFRNLITNAVKFTQQGGKITIDAQKNENFWQIEIKDTGLGMTEEEMKQLFNIKTHFTKQGTAQEKGSGLGLLLCKEFIENNGGKIWVQSQVNLGTSFFFTLPFSV